MLVDGRLVDRVCVANGIPGNAIDERSSHSCAILLVLHLLDAVSHLFVGWPASLLCEAFHPLAESFHKNRQIMNNSKMTFYISSPSFASSLSGPYLTASLLLSSITRSQSVNWSLSSAVICHSLSCCSFPCFTTSQQASKSQQRSKTENFFLSQNKINFVPSYSSTQFSISFCTFMHLRNLS